MKTSLALAPVAALAILLSACTSSTPETPAQAGSVSVEDLTGATVTVAAPAERVACLDGTCIDALAELGLEPVASVQIDQVQSPIFFGPDAATAPLGGSFFEPDIEGILAAQPDIVIGSASVHGELSAALGGIPLYLNRLTTVTDAVTNLERIGELTGRQAQAEEAIARYEETLAAYGPGERPITVLSMYGGATEDIGIDALDSNIGEILSRYTAYPWPDASEGESGFLEISLEKILEVDPEHIWVLDFGFDPNAPTLLDQLASEPIWGRLTAVSKGQVYAADSAWWGTTGGTRGQQAVLDTVLPTLYPEEFPAPLGILR